MQSIARGSVAQIDWRSGFPFPRTDSSYGFSDGNSKRGEAVQDGHTNLELGNLTVEVPRHEALTQQFDTVHPFAGKTIPRIVFWPGSYFDAASAVIAAPSTPNRPTEAA